tara:strand:+ start:1094 stop:1822 length:729 start_codon:yes stop_codon:yes gene_type:complete
MSNLISSPFADYIQEQKKQKYLKKIDASMIASYHVKYYETIIELKKSIINTLEKNNGKILNKNILEKINHDINLVLPYEEYRYKAYHKKPNDKTDKNKIYVYCHHQENYFGIDEFISDVIISESAKDRNSETLLKSEKINYDIIHNLNVRRFADNIQELEKWKKIKASSYDIQYRIDQINNLKNELDNFVKLFDESEGYKHKNYTIMECIEDSPKHSDNMKSYLRKQDEFLVTYDEFRKQNK